MGDMATRNRSFRLDERTLASLDERARETGRSSTALAARYIEEGLRMDEHPLIVFVTRPSGRRPMLAGTRLDVADVVETVKDSGNSPEAAAEYLDLPVWKVRAAIGYYGAFRDEVEAWLEQRRRVSEREEEAWRREQAALA
jgi:uncharacterized protein (DUF433 family)